MLQKRAYRIYFPYMNKRKTKSLMNNSDLIDKKGVLQKFLLLYIYFFICIKMIENIDLTYYQRNREIIPNGAKDYYENDKERLREQARNKYKNLSEEEKIKKREYGKNRYHSISEEKKQKLKEYQKRKYQEAKRSKHNNK